MNRWKLATGILALTLVIIGAFEVNAIPAPGRSSVIEPGSFSEACTYVLYQDSGSFLANSCLTGGNDFKESTASALMADMQTALATSGGEIGVQKGTWTLTSQWPTTNLKNLVVLVGEGPTTIFAPSGGFDPINVTLVNVFNFNMNDKYGIQVSFVCDLVCSGQQQQSFPLDTVAATGIGTTFVTFLGNYIRLDSQAAAFPAFETGYAVIFRNQTSYHSFRIRATLRFSALLGNYPLFFEPVKGDFGNFTGFRWTSTTNLRCRTSFDNVVTETNVAKTMDTNDHTYEIQYQSNSVKFLYDGSLICTHTTNIFPYPLGPGINKPLGPELEACEPDGQIMAIYLKTPFLTPVTV